jgi:hypothetical protein
MPPVPKAYSAAEIAAEAACPEDRVHWLAATGLIRPDHQGGFTYGDALALKMVSALLKSGLPAETIELAAAEGLLSFARTDEYLPYRPGPLSGRTFAEFQADAGPSAKLLPAVYSVLGLAKPDPSTSIHTDEEAIFERFLEARGATPDQDSLIRAARLMAQGTRLVMLGWTELMDEQLVESVAARLAVAETALSAEAYDTAAVQSRGRRCSRCCCASRGDARGRPMAAGEPGVLDVVPLSVATGNVRRDRFVAVRRRCRRLQDPSCAASGSCRREGVRHSTVGSASVYVDGGGV